MQRFYDVSLDSEEKGNDNFEQLKDGYIKTAVKELKQECEQIPKPDPRIGLIENSIKALINYYHHVHDHN